MEARPLRMPVSTIRARLVLEAASEMVGWNDWTERQTRLTLREQGADSRPFSLFGGASPDMIPEVARGDLDVAMLNPGVLLTMAYRGIGPFTEPQPLRAIGVIPSYDQLAFAVAESTGLASLEEVRERRFPLRVSVRGAHDPSVRLLVNQVLAGVGFSLEEIVAWGGEVIYDQPLPNAPSRIGAVERGESDAIFDEAIAVWADRVTGLGMRFLPLGDEHLRRMESVGFRRGVVEKARFPNLPADVPTIDFSGWPLYTHASAPDRAIRSFCAALEARKDRIPWEPTGLEPLPLDRMCHDSVEGPLDVPLHPAAEQFWREQGYLT